MSSNSNSNDVECTMRVELLSINNLLPCLVGLCGIGGGGGGVIVVLCGNGGGG